MITPIAAAPRRVFAMSDMCIPRKLSRKCPSEMLGLVQPNSKGHMSKENYGRDDIFTNPVLDEELKHLNVDDVILKYYQGVKG